MRPQGDRARFRPLQIDSQSRLHRAQDDRWVPTELMLLGQVLEAGGAQKPNVHVRLRDQPQPIIVDVPRELLEREQFPFSGEKLLRVAAERNERIDSLWLNPKRSRIPWSK